eukprot:1605044-Heterocapsa_arctica.AAC.1
MSSIDFFVVEGNLAKGIKEVVTVLDVEPHPHRPVRMSISTIEADYYYWAFQAPPLLPNQRVVGPLPQPPSYAILQQSMPEVKNCIANCSPAVGARLLDRVYAQWANIAEVELQ